MFLFICGLKEGVSQMLPQCQPLAEAHTCLHVRMYPLLVVILLKTPLAVYFKEDTRKIVNVCRTVL